jgi:hypothetical protein
MLARPTRETMRPRTATGRKRLVERGGLVRSMTMRPGAIYNHSQAKSISQDSWPISCCAT